MTPRVLYHYTSPHAALAILQSGTLRASMIHYMNDAREFQYAIELAHEVVSEELRNASGDEDAQRACSEFLTKVRRLAVFATSFSSEDDDLSQWRAYCPVDGGHALEFDGARLHALAENTGFTLRPCIYERDKQIEALRPLVRRLIRFTSSSSIAEWAEGYEAFVEEIALVGAQLKDPAFGSEREWRLIAGPRKQEVLFRANRALIVPYIELKLAAEPSPLTGVLVGPHRHPELATRSVHLVTAQRFRWPIRVRESPIPYRSLE